MKYFLRLNETDEVDDDLKFKTGENYKIGTFVSVETESSDLVDTYTVFIFAETTEAPIIRNEQMFTMDITLLKPPELRDDHNFPPMFVETLEIWYLKRDDFEGGTVDAASMKNSNYRYKLPDIVDSNGDDYTVSIFLGDLDGVIAFNEKAHQL